MPFDVEFTLENKCTHVIKLHCQEMAEEFTTFVLSYTKDGEVVVGH
jgi:hypothetical protein